MVNNDADYAADSAEDRDGGFKGEEVGRREETSGGAAAVGDAAGLLGGHFGGWELYALREGRRVGGEGDA